MSKTTRKLKTDVARALDSVTTKFTSLLSEQHDKFTKYMQQITDDVKSDFCKNYKAEELKTSVFAESNLQGKISETFATDDSFE